jgi:hypothetical protein
VLQRKAISSTLSAKLLFIASKERTTTFLVTEMSDDQIADLINELKRVTLRQQRSIAALEEAHRTADRVSGLDASIPATTTATVIPPFIPTYRSGDHVIITNKVRRSLNRPIDENDRKAVVLEVVSHARINIRTYNGTVTWRAPKNIRHQDDE